MKKNELSISECLIGKLESYFAMHDGHSSSTGLHSVGLYNTVISEIEKTLISETLRYTSGVQAKAANILGISRNTLRKKITEFDL